MAKLRSRRLIVGVILLLAILVPLAAFAERICYKYRDGCTICDFYGPNGEHQGSIEWCF